MISRAIQQAISRVAAFEPLDIYTEEKGQLISVNSLTTRAGKFYEKLRYMVDYKEEHTIRRSAIERIIKRSVTIEAHVVTRSVGVMLLQELVGARYLPNNKISESVAEDIQRVIDKYTGLYTSRVVERKRALSLAATEIDRLLFPHPIDEAIVDAYFETVFPHIVYDGNLSQEELRTQVYIACRRSLLADDPEMLRYALALRIVPELGEHLTEETDIVALGNAVARSLARADAEAAHPLSFKISAKLRNHAIVFRVIREIITKHKDAASDILADPERTEFEVRSLLNARYAQQKKDLQRSGMQAVMYIVLTKILIAFLVELPYEKYVIGSIDYFALSTNVIFHPLLLIFLIATTSHPDEKNTSLIVQSVYRLVGGENVKPIYVRQTKRGPITKAIFVALYGALYVASFGVILYILNALHFNPASIALFLFFLTIVSYFGFRLRYNAKKWTVSVGEEGVIALLWDFFTFPIVRTGRWLSQRFSSVNVFVFILDFIIETPFKFILGTFDGFVHYLRERKEDPL